MQQNALCKNSCSIYIYIKEKVCDLEHNIWYHQMYTSVHGSETTAGQYFQMQMHVMHVDGFEFNIGQYWQAMLFNTARS